jgi:N-acetylmuramoyl-L-alanine amidase
MKLRKDKTDGDSDKEKDFYLIKHVQCPAILSENFFYTNKKDLEYMCSDLGVFEVVRVHVEGTMEYIASLK